MVRERIIIGSRASRLALIQAEMVKDCLKKAHPALDVQIKTFTTKGDRILDKPLAKIGDKGLFTEELENGLRDETIDLAVHSLKDLPTALPEELSVVAYGERREPRDCLVSTKHASLDALPQGAVVGTSSLRRTSQLLHARPDLKIVDLRGNVETRLKKLESENMDAIVIAACGLMRLGLKDRIAQVIEFDTLLPATCQGIVAVEGKEGRADISEIASAFDHAPSRNAADAERAFLATVEGGCQVPVGAHAVVGEDDIKLEAFIGSLDGKNVMRRWLAGPVHEAAHIGTELAREMLDAGGAGIIREMRDEAGKMQKAKG